MISAVLLLTIALVDAVVGLAALRSAATVPGRWWAAATALVVPAAAWAVLGTPLGWAVVVAAWGLLWLALEGRFLGGRGHVAFLAAAVLAVPLAAVGVVAERSASDDSPAAQAFGRAVATAGLQPLTLSFVVAACAAAILLTRSANVVCRAAFGRAVARDTPPPAVAPRRWRIAVGSRDLGSVTEATDVAPIPSDAAAESTLRGGRVIGPLERILIVALALVGAQAVIVGLLAAKGIVRFPEISADGRHGSKAEEFLVGSLVSWTIAGLIAAYLVVQRIA